MGQIDELKFIADHNVGKLARWLRIMGYDTLFFNGSDDSNMVAAALAEHRVVLTRDTGIMKRRLVTSGRLQATLIQSENLKEQLRQVTNTFKLDPQPSFFTLCIECNQPLIERSKEEVKDRVPPYIFQTQGQFMECLNCRRIYWRGTHWQAMTRELKSFIRGQP